MPLPRISVLPPELVNLIAAGEVIERPASVVKELLDNAIDAGADRIAVAIEDGGKQLIRVTDNGCGMGEDDLRLSVLPHATSKLSCGEDLYHITTMGFRGEALASISAVAKLRIASRPHEAAEGCEIRVAGTQLQLAQAAGGPAGTSVEVRDLFFNVPARRRFLRGSATETGHINEEVSRAALARPEIAFEITNNGRVTMNLSVAPSRVERVAKFYGPELAAALMRIERQDRGLTIDAYVAPPAQSRATAQWQYIFVNGRYIRDRFIQHAIREAYRGLMEPNRHAVVFLFLSIDPENVDVNVHPTKVEVRWADSNLVHSQVLSALRETFQRSNLVPIFRTQRPAIALSAEEQERMRVEFAAALKSAAPIRPAEGDAPYFAAPAAAERDNAGGDAWSGGQSGGGAQPWSSFGGPRSGAVGPAPRMGLESGELWRALYGGGEEGGGPTPDSIAPMSRFPAPGAGGPFPPIVPPGFAPSRPRAVQMHNLYLVIESDDGIVIVDQHALHERVMYEHLRRRITEGPLESQRLLLPETVKVSPRQADQLEVGHDLLAKLGMEVTSFGADSVAVYAFPALLLAKGVEVGPFVVDLLDKLATMPGGMSPEVALQDVLSMMACKAAVKAGDPLTPDEIDTLIAQRHLVEKSTNCPHGRPTMLRLTKNDLERQFKRT